MYGKAAVAVAFVLLLLFTYSIFIGNVDLKSYFFPRLPSPAAGNHNCSRAVPTADRPLRVFMYDLPWKFHVGMLDGRSSEESAVTPENLPPWPPGTGLRNQHSAEYWLMASLLCEGGDGDGREAVRVSDPESADVFFVPFFSSLSFNVHGNSMRDAGTEIDRQLQVELVEFLYKSKYWQRSEGRDHVIPMVHPNAFRFLRQQVNASILIVADFGRYPKSLATLRKDVVCPYMHVVDSFSGDDPPDPLDARKTLLFFRGHTIRKAEGKIRGKLAKILAGYKDVHYEKSTATAENILWSLVAGMRSCKFCLHPAGDTPSSCRLFDAIASHCVPVIVSDHIELPYEDELDYAEFSVFFSMKEALQPDYIVNQLRQFPKARWIEMWRRLKKIAHHFEFQYPPKKEDAVDMLWRQIKRKVPAIRLAVHRSQRLTIPDQWEHRR